MKKFYRNTWMQLIVALCTFGFVACQEYEIDSQPDAALNIQIDAQDEYTANAMSPSDIVFNISANTPWTVTSSAEWCQVSPAMSAASSLVSEIVVSLDDNDDQVNPQDRTATLTIEAEAINFTKTVTITQYSREKLVVGNLEGDVTNDGETIIGDGGTVTFTVVSNKPWEIIAYPEFVQSVTPTSGEGNADGSEVTITLNVPANSGAIRSGDLIIRTDFEEVTKSIMQDGVNITPEDPAILEGVPAGGSGGSIVIPISANTEWQYEVPEESASWISVERNGDELTVSVAASNLLWPDFTRSGYVVITPVEEVQGFEPLQIEFTQTGTSHGVYWQHGDTDALDYENNTVTISSTAQNRWSWGWSDNFKKGKLTFTFESVDIPEGTACLDFNFDTWNGQPVQGQAFWHLWIYNNYGRLQAGSPFYQGEGLTEDFDLTVNTNEMVTLSFEVKDSDEAGFLDAIVCINDVEQYRMKVTDLFTTNPDDYWGQLLYFGFAGAGEPVATVTFKSMDRVDYE